MPNPAPKPLSLTVSDVRRLVDEHLCALVTAKQRAALRFDTEYLRTYEPFELALKGTYYTLLLKRTGEDIVFMLTLAVKGRGYPNLSLNDEQMEEGEIFQKTIRRLLTDGLFHRLPNIKEV